MWFFPDIREKKEIFTFLSAFIQKHKILTKDSLYRKDFSFTKFYDAKSGLAMIWSDTYKTFLPELEVKGSFLHDENGAWAEDLTPRGGAGLSITPSSIFTQDGTKLGQLPFDSIISLLVAIQHSTGMAMYEIAEFPQNVRDYFNENQISYEASYPIYYIHQGEDVKTIDLQTDMAGKDDKRDLKISHQRVEYHVFKTPYYSVQFSMSFFDIEPPDLWTLL